MSCLDMMALSPNRLNSSRPVINTQFSTPLKKQIVSETKITRIKHTLKRFPPKSPPQLWNFYLFLKCLPILFFVSVKDGQISRSSYSRILVINSAYSLFPTGVLFLFSVFSLISSFRPLFPEFCFLFFNSHSFIFLQSNAGFFFQSVPL